MIPVLKCEVKFISEDVPQNRTYPIGLFLACPNYAFICLSCQFIFVFKVVPYVVKNDAIFTLNPSFLKSVMTPA